MVVGVVVELVMVSHHLCQLSHPHQTRPRKSPNRETQCVTRGREFAVVLETVGTAKTQTSAVVIGSVLVQVA